jgi:hypothetical protein
LFTAASQWIAAAARLRWADATQTLGDLLDD